MTDDYWSVLQVLLGVLIVLVGLRFAFPQRRRPLAVAHLLVVAYAAMVPGAPVWLRGGALLVAAAVGVALVRGRTRRPGV